MPFKPDLPDRGGWTDSALDAPWEGFALCTECGGEQLCHCCGGAKWHSEGEVCEQLTDPSPHVKDAAKRRCGLCRARGWCYFCGGAGQLPLDPATEFFAPTVPMARLEEFARRHREQS